ncbi:PadR family transcriptional regulator [Actinoplanes couchii]|uniref:PadR family transcriptional regulator n=1 Tax=Actinoplanes couchii TaxID=403638 RepID=A0ABQ3XM52_9ACTN|nr:PadR family transcriptional regulator [Actinoplanes couchii]MDR6319198.1 DNA-binding PadR family transcriptional regulator [Actinoplanes couchii]GID59591.1 PadR family transcriptional regulator [Actinoplanes couchii]
MTKRRVSNLMALAVLAVLAQRPMHPYEIATTLRGQGKDGDFEIKWGSLYTVIRNLDKHHLVAAVGSSRAGARPERTVYRITGDGRDELVDWARELVRTPVTERTRFRAGLSVLSILRPDEAVELLRQRLDLTRESITAARASLAGHAGRVPRLFLVEVEYDLAIQEAEAAWIAALVADITDGVFPGLEAWRVFHETGEIPPELAELAKNDHQQE